MVVLHEGARLYYDREKPGFFKENADYLALIVTVTLALASWFWGLKRRIEGKMKDRADRHNLELTELMAQALDATSQEEITRIRRRLVAIFQQVIQELDTGRLDTGSLHSFALVWNAASDSTRDRESTLT